jgi:hypothetical protein
MTNALIPIPLWDERQQERFENMLRMRHKAP